MSTFRTEPAGHIDDERREHFMKLLMPVYKRPEDFAVAMARDREVAYDLVVEALLRAYENFGRLKDEQAFLSL